MKIEPIDSQGVIDVARVPVLDAIRGMAVLAVVIWHYAGVDFYRTGMATVSWYAQLCSLLWCGVTLFFVLSGFLIGGILLDNANASNRTSVFYMRRACRILPLYILVLISFSISRIVQPSIVSIAPGLFHPPLPDWSYWSFTQNFVMVLNKTMGGHWLAVTWSLAVEEHFYVVLPLLVWIGSSQRKAIVIITITAIISAPLLRCFWPGGYVLMPWHGDALFGGFLIAFATRTPDWLRWLKCIRVGYYAASVGLLLVLAWVLARRGASMGDWLLQNCFSSAFIILLASIVAHPSGWLTKIMSVRSFVWIGQISYGIYLFHEIVSRIIFGLATGATPNCNTNGHTVLSVISLAATIALAQIAFTYIEMPFIRIGKSFRYNRSAIS